MSRPRPSFALPPEAHVPGLNRRPDARIFAAAKAGLSAELSSAALARSAAFRGGLEAYSRGYYWEAHELFEAVWRCLPPAGAERHLLRGLIQLANAGLKARMGRAAAVRRIRALAEASLAEAFLRGQASLMGLSRADVGRMRSHIEAERAAQDNAI